MNLILIVLIIVLLGGGGGYYFVPGPWKGDKGPNHIVGVVITVLVVALLLRALGIF